MNRYRVWLTDVALQSIVVEAYEEKDARKQADELITDGTVEIEDDMEASQWEVTSIDQITE